MCLSVLVVLLVPAASAAAKRKLAPRRPHASSEGIAGHDVKVLQNYLSRAGIRTDADGVFGPGTTKAVRAFERFQQRSRRRQGRDAHRRLVLRDVVRTAARSRRPPAPVARCRRTRAPPPKLPPETPPPVKLGPGMKATVGADGLAVVPILAPPVVQAVIVAGNKIAKMPYIYGGGHGKWEDAGYDCSGSVSYALHGAGLLKTSMPSGGFMNWGDPGPGQWITLYANGGHIYMTVAGLRFDTSGRSRAGSRWQADMRSASGYEVRHPPGL